MFIPNLLLSLSLLNSLPNIDRSHCNDSRGRRLEQPSYLTKDVKVIYNVQTRDKVAFITIDDGVYVSDSLAKFIDDNQLPITTFALAGELWRNRDWFTQRTNMTFENHTNTHAHMTLVETEQQGYEICRASQVIRNVIGERPVFFRPPGGSWNEEVRTAVGRSGIKYLLMWNVQIYKGRTSMSGRKSLGPGDIILLHYTPSLENDLKVLLIKMKQAGLRPALLRDYLH
ncbi:MAG: polysaccharide deacetylase family protein [Actinobacteria bacterium]|nr:MAG: polysaccharide deacetylase family protein [Actinomycetota bacterium]